MSGLTISSLPNELLVAIAIAGKQDRAADILNWETQSTTFNIEWTLSHLSQHFRDVVVGAPELWTLTEADLSVEGSVEILKLYLERSRTREISTTLRDSSYSNAVEEGFLHDRVSEIIVPHVNRMWRLRIVLRIGDRDLEMLVPFREETAPFLQHLEIVCAARDEELPSLVMFSSGAPRFNSLKVDGFALQLPAAAWTASLTHLELRRQQDAT